MKAKSSPPTTTKFAEHHPNETLIRQDRLPHIWCPGCGIGNIIGTFAKAVNKDPTPNNLHVVVSGIGCSGRAAGYLNLDSYHATHGRAIPFATGLKLANNKLKVSVISGDGDLSTIGGNHIIHAARRNLDLTIVFNNNFTYGMTGGQYSATTPHGAITGTSSRGNFEHPFNMAALMKACGATYIARWTALHIKQMEKAFSNALEHKGFAFVEIISPCPAGFGKKNKFRTALDSMKHYEDKTTYDDYIELNDASLTMNPMDNIAVGEFFQSDLKDYQNVKLDFLKGGK